MAGDRHYWCHRIQLGSRRWRRSWRFTPAGSDPIVDIRNTSAGNGSFPAPDYSDYHRLRLGPVSYFAQAAEAEFTLRKRGTPGELHGRARVFTITNGGQEYFVQMTALSTTWDRSQPVFNAFLATFRPAT